LFQAKPWISSTKKKVNFDNWKLLINIVIKIFLLLKNQEFTSYFEKLSFGDEIDIGELEKLFNFCEYFPSVEEMNEAKMNVLNCKWF